MRFKRILSTTNTLPLAVSIGSDAASWVLEIKGNGPDDFDICRLAMPKDLVWLTNTYEFCKGNSYTLTLHWINNDRLNGYNGDHTNLAGFLTNFAKTNDFTDVELIASPVFRKFDNDILHETNCITIAQTELNKVLGDGIPATSFAAGANETGGVADNYNYQSQTPNGWPLQRQEKQGEIVVDAWLHSDVKNVANYYVHKLFEKIVKGE